MEATPRECQHCGAPFVTRRSTQRFCSRNCRGNASYRRMHPRSAATCVDCGVEVEYPNAGAAPQRCPDCSRYGWVNYKQMHRAKEAGVVAEFISAFAVFERDKWTCGVCHKSVSPRDRFPSAKCATIDHVIPLSQGGSHTYDNVRCCHMGCNTARNTTEAVAV